MALQWTINSETGSESESILIEPKKNHFDRNQTVTLKSDILKLNLKKKCKEKDF